MTIDWNAVLRDVLSHGVRITLILGVSLLLYRMVVVVSRRLQDRIEDDDPTTHTEAEKRARTLGRIARQVAGVSLTLVAGMMTIRELGFDIGPIIAGAGIAGLAIGFGAQNLVRDIITGFFLLLENQIRVGDVVEVAGKTGKVEAVNLRTTVLRDLEGVVHIVPNGEIKMVSNFTVEWSRAVLDVGVAYREDVDRVIAVLEEVGRGLHEDPVWRPRLLEPMEILGVEALADSSVNIRIALKTQPLQQWAVAREMRRRIKRTFDARGIEIPFPHTTVVLGPGQAEALTRRLSGTPPPGEA